jgi:hypothetical protein
MTIDWASLGLVAVTTVVAALAIVGIFALGVVALTSGPRTEDGPASPSPGARVGGYLCMAVSGLLVLYGIYLIVPLFH